jgi:hypothetical protein
VSGLGAVLLGSTERRTAIYGRSRIVIAQDARCCAVTQEERYCRREPLPETPECLDLPDFIQLCAIHANKAVEVHLYRQRQDADRQARERYEEQQRRAREATVYYVQRAKDGLIKIGFSSVPRERLVTLRREHGPLELLATHKGGRDAERIQHRRFDHLRVTGEWFRPEPELLAHIERINARHAESGRAA